MNTFNVTDYSKAVEFIKKEKKIIFKNEEDIFLKQIDIDKELRCIFYFDNFVKLIFKGGLIYTITENENKTQQTMVPVAVGVGGGDSEVADALYKGG